MESKELTHLSLPNNIGDTISVEYNDGSKHYYVIDDEIIHVNPDTPNQALYFQRLVYKRGEQIQFRFCYYFADKSGWVFAQRIPYLRNGDFEAIVRQAVRRGWVTLDEEEKLLAD